MRFLLTSLLSLLSISSLFSQAATNDYILSQKPASGPLVPRAVTPAVGRLLGWPSSINAPAAITLGTGLTLTGTTLTAGGGGALSTLTDVQFASLAGGHLLLYNSGTGKWENTTRANILGDTLTALDALANAAGVLTNDGAGSLTYTATSNGGNGAADDGKVAIYESSGGLGAHRLLLLGDGASTPGYILLYNGSNEASGMLRFAGSGFPDWFLPDASGTLLLSNGSGSGLTALNASNISSGTLAVERGGTGSTSLTANNVLLGNGTSAVQVVAPGTSGNVLTSNGTTWVSSAAAGAGHTIKEEGSGLTARAGLNFVGGGVTAADDAGNNETDVTVTRTGVYRTIYLAAAAGIPRTTNGCGVGSYESSTNKINYDTLEFDASTDEKAQWLLKMPDEWNGGTIKAKVAWTAASSSGNTYWELRAGALTDDDAIDTALGTAATTNDTLTATGDLDETAATGACTVGNSPAAGKYVVFELSRDADNGSDTLAADALVIGVTIQYQESSTEPSSW